MTEIWKDIDEPGYQVSNLGQVMGPKGLRKLSPDSEGYLSVTLRQRGRRVHKLVAEAFLGPCPEGLQVRHKDGNHLNPALENLEYGTPTANRLDSVAHGTHWHASKTHCAQKHEYTPENTRVQKLKRGGYRRVCKTCEAKWQKKVAA